MQENVSSFKFIHKLKQSLHFQKICIMVVKNLGNSKIYSEFQEFFLKTYIHNPIHPTVNSSKFTQVYCHKDLEALMFNYIH